MFYYGILVRSATYHGKEALVYNSSQRLVLGTVVRVPLRAMDVTGVIVSNVEQPSFATKPIHEAYPLVLPAEILKLASWMQEFYPAPLGIIAQHILPPKVSMESANLPAPDVAAKTPTLPPLTKDQHRALGSIKGPGTFLLHGKTGSGKTRIYIELAKRVIANDRSAIILTPEIGLTSQLAQNFMAVFGKRIVVIHSQQSPAEHRSVWLRVATSTTPIVLIGPRSAIFSPLQNVGLIVVDESHETAYKQEQAPNYQAVRVASRLATLHNAQLILGSATPSINDYYIAERKGRPIIELRTLAKSEDHPPQYTVVDLKDRTQFARAAHLSQPLTAAIAQSLQRHEQILLYLNRRGTARAVLCEQCGWQAVCPHCDLPLTYHGDNYQLRCHTCGFQQAAVTSCPVCNYPSIRFKTVGTKAIVDEVSRLFPEARVQRFDTDNKKAERLEANYENIRLGNIDILVGTQLLAKGLDLPRLSTLGVILADSSLSIPDFTAQERTYQLLTQVLGRIGRGHVPGQAIIQTYHPDHPVIAQILNNDWQAFYHSELAERRKFMFPPFCYLLKLTCKRASARSAEKAALTLKNTLASKNFAVVIEGPAPSFHERVTNKFQWQLIVKAKNRHELLRVIEALPQQGWKYDIDPINLL